MSTTPAICRLVEHHGGPTAVSQKLGGSPVYQEIQRWVKRGWASPKHIFRLEPLLLEGMTVRALYDDLAAVPADTPPAPVGEHAAAATQRDIDRIVCGSTAPPSIAGDKPSRGNSERG